VALAIPEENVSAMILKIDNLSYARQQKILFSNVCLELSAGELLLIEGPNGSGKSSLLRLLVGLSTPSQGDIIWQGHSIHKNFLVYTEHLHYIGHTNGLKLGLTVIENLKLLRHFVSSSAKEIPKILSFLQLTQDQHTPVKYLSAGQKRRLSLVKLFLFPKKLWILDEPFTALDKHTQACLLSQLTLHLQNGGISIISSHQPIHIKNVPTQHLRLDT